MGGTWKLAAGLVIVALAATAFAACGDESSTTAVPAGASELAEEGSSPAGSEGGGEEAGGDAETEGSDRGEQGSRGSSGQAGGGGEAEAPAPKPETDTGGESPRFSTPAKSPLPRFGAEATEAERERAEAALLAYLDASEAGDWEAACGYVAAKILTALRGLAADSEQLEGKSCPQVLALLTKAAKAEHANRARGVDSLRVQGYTAFALFHGIDGIDYSMPMLSEGGEWKVTSLAPKELR